MLRFSPYDKVKFLAISISFPFNVAWISSAGTSSEYPLPVGISEEEYLVNILKGKEKMSRSEIEKAAEMEKSKAVRTLNSLIEKKILKKTGAGRGVRYTLK